MDTLSAGPLPLRLLACIRSLAIVLHAPVGAVPSSHELMLVNAKTGKSLTIAGGVSTENNVEAVQFDCDSDPSRRWTLTRDGGRTSTR